MKRGGRTFIRQIGGREVEVTLNEADLEIHESDDLDERRSLIAADIGTVGGLMAEVDEEIELADAEYRAWRARMINVALNEDGKFAEWKTKSIVEALPEFIEHKKAIGALEGDQTYLKWYLEALRTVAIKLETVRNQDRRIGQAENAARTHVSDPDADDRVVEKRRRPEVENVEAKRASDRRKKIAAIMSDD